MEVYGLSFVKNNDGSIGATVKVLTPPEEGHVDSWHYTGSRDFHANPVGARFIAYCKEHLTKCEFPITVGNTGYPNLEEDIDSKAKGWMIDSVGRFVCVMNGKLYFQRYLEGDLIMCGQSKKYSSCSDLVSNETLESLMR